MDRLTQLRGEAGSSKDSSFDSSSAQSESYLTANESSKYFSLSEENSTLDISPIKDVSLNSAAAEAEKTIIGTDQLIPNLSPISKQNELLDSYKFGKQIEAANILSGGVDIFDDNENSYDGGGLVIDDNVVDTEDKSNPEPKDATPGLSLEKEDDMTLVDNVAEASDVASKDTEIVLQIDGKNVNAINIGNGLYLYRKEGQEELAAVQIIDDDGQQPSFKFLKVRENAEGNLEVYEEIEIEVPKETTAKDGKPAKKIPPTSEKSTVNSEAKTVQAVKSQTPPNELTPAIPEIKPLDKEITVEPRTENLNHKMNKFNETRKSPVIHSTPNKEGIPLTKTMVDQQLHPNRHLDKVKTIEVHTDNTKNPTESYNSKNPDLLKHPKRDISQDYDLKGSKDVVSKTNTLLEQAGSKNISEFMTSSNVADQINTKLGDIVKLENIKTDNTNTVPALIKNASSEANKLQKQTDLDNAIELTIQKPTVDSSEITKDIKFIDKIKVLESPETLDEKDGKVVEISPVKGENTRVIESTNTTVTKTDDPIQCKTQTEHDKDVVDCAKTVLPHQIQAVTAPEEKVKPTENSNVGKEETAGPVKSEIHSIQQYPKLAQNYTMTTPSSSEHGISGSKNVETKTSLFQSEKLNKTQNLFQDINKATQRIAESTKIPIKVTSDDIKMSVKGDTKFVPLNFSLGSKVPALISSSRSSHSSDTKTVVPQTSGQVERRKDKIISNNIGDKATSAQFRSNPILKSEDSHHIPEKKLDISKLGPPKTNLMPVTVRSLPDTKMNIKRDVVTVRPSTNFEINPNNNNHTAAVPFGKWTEANRQEYLNRFKETKVTPNTNAKQIKQPTDLNKREFLQKIDIQKQNTNTTVKLNQRRVAPKLNVKTETKTLANKPIVTRDVTLPVKTEASGKGSFTVSSKPDKTITKAEVAKPILQTVVIAQSNTTVSPDNTQQKRNQELIDKTIEGIINRVITSPPEDLTPSTSNVVPTERKNDIKLNASRTLDQQVKNKHPASLDAIEMKMNELHGIPFIERPPHQLPKLFSQDVKTYSKADTNKVKVTSASSVSTSYLQKIVKQNEIEVDSEEEIIEHEPVTGDMDIKTKPQIKPQIPTQSPASQTVPATTDTPKNEAIITEKDFDKFVRRNSITYENQLTVNFEATNAVPKVVEKDQPPSKKFSRNELLLAEAKVKSDQKQQHRINHPNKISPKPANDDAQNKHYQSKLQIAYQSALTAKRKIEPPLPPPVLLLEDKPVKVLLVDESSGFIPSQLNVQGKELSPKKKISDIDVVVTTKNASQHTDLIENVESKKEQDDIKVKGKHPRKQVLTPVDTPELELIEPHELGLAGSPKKKRRTIEPPLDESPKNLKTYLLGRNKVAEETESPPQDLSKAQIVRNPANVTDTATAIDNLVKAAELLETQSENLNLNSSTVSVDSQVSQPTPLKRGRGRPRKYPLGESPADKSKVESSQKRPRLIDATPTPRKESIPTDEDTSDEEIIRDNWTMGKINENIVCPICKKLFRSENVVFKHVKHCTGPSPNRSESDNVSRKSIQSQESETKSLDSKLDDVDYEPPEERTPKKITPKKRKSKDAVSESSRHVDDIIVIEDTPKQKPKPHESRTSSKAQPLPKDSLACETCGKTFRQLSYLVSHKWQHKKEAEVAAKSVFCCEVCNKEFRKLHHLVQHRLIHNPTTAPNRTSRKSSFENVEQRSKNAESSKPSEDPSAGFRCEPCDKSFRKLHHLVEHRETHDGQNRQKSVPASQAPEASDPPPQCDICKKTFRKLHHLIEHKEQHLDTTSEKSDDKSVKSSLSTKDIIHECRLCYMVFPNEHSLNKHSVFCQRKKKPAVKPPQPDDEEVAIVIDSPEPSEEQVITDTSKPDTEENVIKHKDISPEPPQPSKPIISSAINEIETVKTPEKVPTKENTTKLNETTLNNTTDKKKLVAQEEAKKTALEIPSKSKKIEEKVKEIPPKSKKMVDKVKETPAKSKKLEAKVKEISLKPKIIEDKVNEVPIVKTVPKRKTSVKEKVTAPVTKRPKPTNMPLPAIKEVESLPESSDDDEVRYMLNPDYTSEPGRLFMEVRASKRSSLQIEKPNKESVKRRASLQHPPKVPRFKTAVVEDKAVPTKSTAFTKNALKVHKPESPEPVPSTDSDDSDVKYSFPETVTEKPETPDPAKTIKRKSITNKRKSLSGMAKRKSLGKPPTHKHRERSPAPVKLIKRRTLGVEHRCDCGQLFGSAALLSRHTTLSHTPPRIRRRRSPPPEGAQPTTRKSADSTTSKNHTPGTTRKSRSAHSAHRGVPVPEKTKKLAQKLKS